MLEYVKQPYKDEESLDSLEHYASDWFKHSFKELTPPQKYAFKLISDKNNTIITAPTGSGKTLSGFLSIISELFKMGEKEKLEDMIYCIYISPLKALDNDIKRNLSIPLEEIRRVARIKGIELPEVRTGIRTGDTTPYERQKQLKRPPHILITTPESIAILLNSPKFSEKLKKVKWVIIDEIHELANNKRGVHLSLSLERLEEFTEGKLQRIGMGATLHPIDEVAKYLVGYEDGKKKLLRNCKIVDVSWVKKYDLKVVSPVKDVINASPEETYKNLYKMLDDLISKHTTTLIFTNTRSGTERVIYRLKELNKEKYNDDTIAAHHGSLSRETRLEVEERLKQGKLKAVVCSTSLELGVDIGYIDLVIQIGSPKSATRAVQRIGRCGRSIHDTAKGILIATDRDDLVESVVMLRNAKEKKLDALQIPKDCLDILSQHIVGLALTKRWSIDYAFHLIKRSYNYSDLDKETFLYLLRYLSGEYLGLRERKVYGKIWLDENEKVFGARGKHTRTIYYLNSGSIADETRIDVVLNEGNKFIGGIEEGFLEKMKKDDIFVLGGKMYKYKFARGMRCIVDHAPKDAVPTIPAWFSQMLPLSYDLALSIQEFRRKIKGDLKNKKKKKEIVNEITENYPTNKEVSESIYEYFYGQDVYTGRNIPDDKNIIIEKTRDIEKRNHIVFHTLYGRRVNDALSRAAAVVASDWLGKNVGVLITDNGFSIMTPRELENIEIENIVNKLMERDLLKLLKKNIRRTELMKRRFRHNASRSFLILRNYLGYKISVRKQQISSQRLFKICEEIDPDFPVIRETYREIFQDVFDMENAKNVLERMKNGELKYKIIETPIASPFAHNLIILGHTDIVLMENRKKRLMELHKEIMRRING